MQLTPILSTLALLLTVVAPITAAPAAAAVKRASEPVGDYISDYYEWVPVKYDSYSNYDSYKGYNLVKAEYQNKDDIDVYVCMAYFKDKTYRIGWFDPKSAYTCTVVYNGEAVEVNAKRNDCEAYFLSTFDTYGGYWATHDELGKYGEDKIVYAPDHDCVTGQVCWTEDKPSTSYTPPKGDKTGKWYEEKRKRSWTRSLGRRDDFPPEYKAPSMEYCYIGYGSTVTDYKVFYAYDGKTYQSDDFRYSKDVKALVIIVIGSKST